MDYAYEIRRQAEAAPRAALPAVTVALWKAFGEGHLSETEAEALSGLIEARQLSERPTTLSQRPNGAPRSPVGSRPRTDASMERRRRWAAAGRLSPAIAARFTLAEQAVLAVVAAEVAKRGTCALSVGAVAALAGVSPSTVQRAVREAKLHGLVTVEERRLARFRNDTNVVCIVSHEWKAWLRLARRQDRPGGGFQTGQGTNTPVSYPVNSEGWRPHKGCRMVEGDIAVRASPGMRQGRVRA
ncbi:helix-turn-helix domain-containing protein [Methylobacterium sp. WL116]|uniref:helix-turn-helix domain-containing protein n=1 Tax=Methylobacterium sp. WL116 TaxID=2603889 RepID=UPI0011C90FC0|nr:helix-turn-helix domain-containing protein [Methylobacterium sp. WL116]TXM94081.1 helix-turn-helix domain-containing protein [Methylobacterium sp. WL116]